MTDFNPIAFFTGIMLSRFINDVDRFDELILYDIICHNEKNRFAITFGYYHHELCSEGSYMSTLYEKACKTHVVSAFYRDNYTVNINGKPAKNYIILVELSQPCCHTQPQSNQERI